MTRATIAGAACVSLVLLAVACDPAQEHDTEPTAPISSATPSTSAADVQRGFIYGRITDVDGPTYEGRLRWGRNQEAFWGDFFNSSKEDNPWVDEAPRFGQHRPRHNVELFGIQLGSFSHDHDSRQD